MLLKLIAAAGMSLVSAAVLAIVPGQGPDGPRHEPKKHDPKKAKGEEGPAGDLRKAYDAIRRLPARDGGDGRPEERLRDWARRARDLYRKGIQAHEAGDPRLAHEYGAAAHDLARATEHAGNATRADREDDLPPPPGDGPEEPRRRTFRDLRRAFDRIKEADGPASAGEGRFYLDAARDLYKAARRDAEGDRLERAGELARASEAMTHVPEHLGHIKDLPDAPRDVEAARKDLERVRKDAEKARKDFEARKKDHPRGPEEELPPPIDE